MIGFSEFFETYYQNRRPCLTTADEMRNVVCAYKQYRLCQGLAHELMDVKREAFFAAQMEYHTGACELAELSGDPTRTIKHREALIKVWELWFWEISDEEGHSPAPKCQNTCQIGFWKRLIQEIRKRSGIKD